jgi:hypothetical protein
MRNKMSHRTLALSVGLVCSGILAAHAAVASLQLPAGPIGVGDTFDVEVWSNGSGAPQELLAFGFDVDPDSTLSLVTYTGYAMSSGAMDSSSGPNNVSGMFFPGATDPDVMLAILSFTADAVGTETLTVRGLADGLFYGLFITEFSSPVDTNDDIDASGNITIVPEPASALAAVAGLLAFVMFRRSFKR